MKQQNRKGFRQTFDGVTYHTFTIKLDAGTKLQIRNEVSPSGNKTRK